jgi:hypothetical protein
MHICECACPRFCAFLGAFVFFVAIAGVPFPFAQRTEAHLPPNPNSAANDSQVAAICHPQRLALTIAGLDGQPRNSLMTNEFG